MKRAVIVENSLAARNLIKLLLSQCSYPIEVIGECIDGQEAIAFLNEAKPDIAFMDISLPGCNGLDVIETVKKSNPNMLFIIITAYSCFEWAQKALRLGVIDIILKPIDKKQFLSAVGKLFGQNFTTNNLLNDVIAYLHKHYHENITLTSTAKKFYTSADHLSRLFKNHCQVTFSSYLNKIRIQESKGLLLSTRESIEEISKKVGYNNVSYFYRIFKKYVNATPSEYRKSKSWFVERK